MSKILGIDYGTKRIGLAISDEEMKFAFSYQTIEVRGLENTITMISKICQQELVKEVIIGLPLDQNGQLGPAALLVKKFGATIAGQLGVAVKYEDERFTTSLAGQLFRESGRQAKKVKHLVDQKSAQIILQTFLDKKHG